jgi:hypothetical protein
MGGDQTCGRRTVAHFNDHLTRPREPVRPGVRGHVSLASQGVRIGRVPQMQSRWRAGIAARSYSLARRDPRPLPARELIPLLADP